MPVQRFRLCFRSVGCTPMLLLMLSFPTMADDATQVPAWRLRLNMGQSLEQRGELDAAEREMGLALSAAGRVLESDVPLAKVLDAMGSFYDDVGKFSDAEQCWTNSLAVWGRILGPQHIALNRLVGRLASLYVETHQRAKAERLDLEGWTRRVEHEEPGSLDLIQLLENLATLKSLRGETSEAEAMFLKALNLSLDSDGSETAESAALLNNLGLMCFEARRYDAAIGYLTRSLRARTRLCGHDDPNGGLTSHTLAEAYEAVGRYQEAEPLLTHALTVVEGTFGPTSFLTAVVLKSYAHFLRTHSRSHEAKKLEARVRTIEQRAGRDGASRAVIDIRELSLR